MRFTAIATIKPNQEKLKREQKATKLMSEALALLANDLSKDEKDKIEKLLQKTEANAG